VSALNELLDLVLGKRELSGINKDFARQVLLRWLEDNPSVAVAYRSDPKRFTRKKEFQRLRSEVRKELRTVYGAFFKGQYPAKKKKAVAALIAADSEANAHNVLKLHRSTAERLNSYPFLYEQLLSPWGAVDSILDLGCGFNPFAYRYLAGRPAYFSADIACEDLDLINAYLESLGVRHEERCVDLTDVSAVASLPRAKVAFAFKLLDSLEDLQRDVTARLLDVIPADWLIVSFPTMSLGQTKPIGTRQWFEKLVTGKVLTRVTLPNEQFIIITLKQKESVTGSGQ
jgi:hypothetical protein